MVHLDTDPSPALDLSLVRFGGQVFQYDIFNALPRRLQGFSPLAETMLDVKGMFFPIFSGLDRLNK